MAKKYKVEWHYPISISEYRGVKKTENPMVIFSLGKLVKEEVKKMLDDEVKNVDMRNITHQELIGRKQEIETKIATLKGQMIVQKDNRIYYHKPTMNMKDIQTIMTWVQKRNGRGTYHLFDEERQLINKGQIIVPNHYRHIALENSISTDYLVKSSLKQVKKDLAFYYSQWEIDEVLWSLMLLKEKKIEEIPKWLREQYGERADYFRYFMKKDIYKLIMLSML